MHIYAPVNLHPDVCARDGLTQERLAERLGLSSNFIAHLERGSRQPSLDTIVILARELKVPIASLFRA
jgi:transcriptional regulator with XRE-family HTH domain